MTKESGGIIALLRREPSPIVVYGVNLRLTEAVLLALRWHGFTPVCLTDGRRELAGGMIDGVPVLTPEEVFARYRDAHVFICPSNAILGVREYLAQNGMTRLHDAIELVNSLDYAAPGLLKTVPPETVRTALAAQKSMLTEGTGEFAINQATLIVTERCTLNCVACSNCMPFFTRPADYSLEQLVHASQRLAGAVDFIGNLSVSGGESFLYKDLGKLLSRLDAIENITSLQVFTNGTLVPSEELVRLMREIRKLVVIGSNYGKHSRRIGELADVLRANGIAYEERHFSGEWRDLGDFSERGLGTDGLRELYLSCYGHTCNPILDGHLYRCCRSAFGTKLGFIPKYPGDFVDLVEPEMPLHKLRSKLYDLLFDTTYLRGCDHCDGISVNNPPIEEAIQQLRC